jgi:hypothetical protein
LKELGLASLGHHRKLLKAISELIASPVEAVSGVKAPPRSEGMPDNLSFVVGQKKARGRINIANLVLVHGAGVLPSNCSGAAQDSA